MSSIEISLILGIFVKKTTIILYYAKKISATFPKPDQYKIFQAGLPKITAVIVFCQKRNNAYRHIKSF